MEKDVIGQVTGMCVARQHDNDETRCQGNARWDEAAIWRRTRDRPQDRTYTDMLNDMPTRETLEQMGGEIHQS